MPNKTIYIRKEDEELWTKLPDKASAVSKMLRGGSFSGVMVTEEATEEEVRKLIKQSSSRYDPVVLHNIKTVSEKEYNKSKKPSKPKVDLDSIPDIKRASELPESLYRVYHYRSELTVGTDLTLAEAEKLKRSSPNYLIEKL